MLFLAGHRLPPPPWLCGGVSVSGLVEAGLPLAAASGSAGGGAAASKAGLADSSVSSFFMSAERLKRTKMAGEGR